MDTEPETKVLDGKTPSKVRQATQEPVPSVHRVVGRYELIHRLGHGGMATVFLGRATGTAGFEKLVAVKVIHPHLANEPEFVEMFLDEARIAAQIRHPHVVEIHDLGDSGQGGVFYMVMEYVEGATLSGLLRQLRNKGELLPIPVVLQIMADACEGLAAAHELCDRDGQPYGLVHRDVSPQNFLVSMNGWVKLVDFGIMKAAGKRSTTLTGQLRGKLPYMSPEQAHSMPVDHRTDLFALGAVLWELLTNERLFGGLSEIAVLEKITQCELPDIASKREDLPEQFDRLLRRTLTRDPDERYESARAMLTGIKQLQRTLAGDVDARRQLAELMHAHFSSQVSYARAAVRGATDHSGELDLFVPRAGESLASGSADASPIPGAMTPSRAPMLPVGNTQTLTSGVHQPSRQWLLWLLLPLVGATIGTLVVVAGGAREPEGSPPTPAGELEPMPTKAAEPAEITWTFNTDPQGATVVIGGERHSEPTPTEVTVPRGDEVVVVEFELDGFEPGRLRLRPVRTENAPPVTLRRISSTAAAINPVISAKPTPPADGKPGGKRRKPAARAKPPADAGREPKRKIKGMPDFDKVVPDGG